MKSATRVVVAIAMGGTMAGAAVALWQVPAPKAATVAAVSTPDTEGAMQQLADESAQLHGAIASAQTRLAELHAGAAAPSPDLAALLAQADSQLATARQRLAADETLLAQLQAAGHVQHPSATTAPKPTQALAAVKPTPSETASTAPTEQQVESTPTASEPTHQHTHSPQPTNRGGDD